MRDKTDAPYWVQVPPCAPLGHGEREPRLSLPLIRRQSSIRGRQSSSICRARVEEVVPRSRETGGPTVEERMMGAKGIRSTEYRCSLR